MAPEALTLEEAAQLIDDRAAKGPAKGKAKPKARKKAPARKSPARKSAT
jgi:DNA topoisomerase-1